MIISNLVLCGSIRQCSAGGLIGFIQGHDLIIDFNQIEIILKD